MRARLRDSIVPPSLHKPSADADRGGRGGGGGVCWGGGEFLWRPSSPVSKPSGIATGFLPQIKGAHLNFGVSSGDIEGPISLSVCR